ncbi:MAG: serine/threonine protein kinase [Anaerolineae bacterium]|nr:serine/threonine protein kinase [Anaerolineae bacterium]
MADMTGELTGKTLGQYEIGQQLGQGGMATVYLARQKSIGRTVAIKVMPQHFLHDPSFLQRFEHEVKIIAALQHPRVLPVYDYGQIENRPYIVMAYISGGTLADQICKGPLSLDQIARLTDQIAEGLGHAHRKGIIHRDFKPSNILLDENGNAYLADFGIAKISESTAQLTGSGIIGTPSYMAPEMGEKNELTPAVDIYALGVTLFQMFTGHLPYQGDTPIRLMMAHASNPIPDVRATCPELPDVITEIINKAMAKRPEDRYATVDDLAADLRQAAQGHHAGQELYTIELGSSSKQRAATSSDSHAAPLEEAPLSPSSPPLSPTSYTSEPALMYTPPPTPKKSGCGSVMLIALVGIPILICIGLFLMLGGLGGLAALGSIMPTSTPIPPTATPLTHANLTIDNQSKAEICVLYISPEEADQWGDSRLEDGSSIPIGKTYIIEDIKPGIYDLRAKDCSDNVIADKYGINLTIGEHEWEVPADLTTLNVINDTSQSLCELYIVSSDQQDWGTNQLDPGEVIVAGRTFTLSNIPIGSYNLKVVTCDTQESIEQYDELLDASTDWTIYESD